MDLKPTPEQEEFRAECRDWLRANLPEETIFYKARLEGSWETISLLLMAGHFGVPFFYLMGRDVKRRGWTLAVGGAWLLVMHFVDLYWQVMPTLHPDGVRPSPLDATTPRLRMLEACLKTCRRRPIPSSSGPATPG